MAGPPQLRRARSAADPRHIFRIRRRSERRRILSTSSEGGAHASEALASMRDSGCPRKRLENRRSRGKRPSGTRTGSSTRPHVKAFLRQQRRRHRRLRGTDPKARLPPGPRRQHASGSCRSTPRRCATTATTSPTTRRPPELRHARRLPGTSQRSARRGIAVITELVINHTSDQHPWFQRAQSAARIARSATSTSGATPTRNTADARIIFTDTEKSNWTWDPVAKAYYWHRFFSHQPDLNFDNPAVVTMR